MLCNDFLNFLKRKITLQYRVAYLFPTPLYETKTIIELLNKIEIVNFD